MKKTLHKAIIVLVVAVATLSPSGFGIDPAALNQTDETQIPVKSVADQPVKSEAITETAPTSIDSPLSTATPETSQEQIVYSPDGKWAVKDERAIGRLLIRNQETGEVSELIFTEEEQPVLGFTVRNKGIYFMYSQNGETKISFVFYENLNERIQIVVQGQVQISPDGKWLVKDERMFGRLLVTNQGTGEVKELIFTEEEHPVVAYTLNNKGIYFVYIEGGQQKISFVYYQNLSERVAIIVKPQQVVTSPNGVYAVKDERINGRLLVTDTRTGKTAQLLFSPDEHPIIDFQVTDKGIYYYVLEGRRLRRRFVSFKTLFA